MSNSYTIIDQYEYYPFFQQQKKIVAAHVAEFLEVNHIFINTSLDSERIIPLATLL